MLKTLLTGSAHIDGRQLVAKNFARHLKDVALLIVNSDTNSVTEIELSVATQDNRNGVVHLSLHSRSNPQPQQKL